MVPGSPALMPASPEPPAPAKLSKKKRLILSAPPLLTSAAVSVLLKSLETSLKRKSSMTIIGSTCSWRLFVAARVSSSVSTNASSAASTVVAERYGCIFKRVGNAIELSGTGPDRSASSRSILEKSKLVRSGSSVPRVKRQSPGAAMIWGDRGTSAVHKPVSQNKALGSKGEIGLPRGSVMPAIKKLLPNASSTPGPLKDRLNDTTFAGAVNV